jgi:hypothetical protein
MLGLAKTDNYGSTPLHVAAMLDDEKWAMDLIKQGADLNAQTYKTLQPASYLGQFTKTVADKLEYWEFDTLGKLWNPWYALTNKVTAYTPLDLALMYAPGTKTTALLLDANAPSIQNGTHLPNDVMQAIQFHDEVKLRIVLDKIEVLAQKRPDWLWLVDHNGNDAATWSHQLQWTLTQIEDFAYIPPIIDTINHLNATDPFHAHESYIAAKMLLHAFPSFNTYTYTIGTHHSALSAIGMIEGHTGTQAHNLIDAYYQLTQEPAFENIELSYRFASIAEQYPALWETSELLYEAYSQGVTLVLPCLWQLPNEGHFLNYIVDQKSQVFGVADAYDNYAKDYGFSAYNMHAPLEVNDIYNILNNHNRMDTDFYLQYKLQLTPNSVLSFATEKQPFLNCTWNNQLITQKALLLLEAAKTENSPAQAQEVAQSNFDAFNDFQQTKILENYLALPTLSKNALQDILHTYHSDPVTDLEKHRAILLEDAISGHSNVQPVGNHHQIPILVIDHLLQMAATEITPLI